VSLHYLGENPRVQQLILMMMMMMMLLVMVKYNSNGIEYLMMNDRDGI